ncbi:MAG: UDP-3-O-(3-hydroxymyristoyl)glucosamine N-acyltransferase [Thermoflavifilum sp.]|nr:UDP-3-O-(3-hydroxymyristoyl)glucosamine N-acyltransferase [Thermoflavifilum sp.]
MQLPAPISVEWIAKYLHGEIIGNAHQQANGINEIHQVRHGDITFVDHEKYYKTALQSAATVVLINQRLSAPAGKTLILVDDPFRAYNQLVRHFHPFSFPETSLAQSIQVGEGTRIAPEVVIGEHVQIGKDCLIYPHVTIYDHCIIGDRVIIHSGTVIGADAFYYKKRTGEVWQYEKMISCGRVVIENDVEVGANCTIDKGVSGDTLIGAGTKIDNLVHVGHDTRIGKGCLIAAQVGIAGTVIIEDHVTLWGQVGVSKDLTIGREAVVLAQSGVPSSLKGGQIYFGYPAEEARYKRREIAWIKRIPEIWEKVKHL